MTFIRLSMLLVAMMTLIAGCATPGNDSSALPKTLRVGMATNYAPIVFEKDGNIVGLEADFAKQLEDSLDIKVELKQYPWQALPEALNNNEVDVVMSGVSITKERKDEFLFTKPYMRVGQMAIIRTQDVGRLSAPGALESGNYKIGYSLDTTGQVYVTSKLSNSHLIGFSTNEEGVQALIDGKVDYYIHDAPTVWKLTSLPPIDKRLLGLYTPLTSEFLAWVVRKEDQALKQQLDAVLDVWMQSGYLQKTINKWLPVTVVTEG